MFDIFSKTLLATYEISSIDLLQIDVEGYDYEEICEILQISYANCRTLISRAKESLRQKLAHAS